ncbi:MAG: endonuclease/exonuclease/phosphatase family protein [Deltaproteobacteria bacterium]|nr:endonuclease/exonuclease/phosphatase family protein [Deltaproteobacteria bacterium]
MQIRIITYNVHKCIGGVDRRYQPKRIHQTLDHYRPDVVLLQEVDHDAKRSRRHHQTELLGDMLDMRHRAYFPNVTLRRGGAYGNAILSRFPLTDSQNIDLTVPPKKRRAVMHARLRIRTDGDNETRTLHVFNMHLGLLGMERKIQLRRFLTGDPVNGLHPDAPVVVGGDLNDLYGTLGPKLLEPAGFRTARKIAATFPAVAPMRTLDGLYVRGQVVIKHLFRASVEIAKRASDHLPLVADLVIPGPNGPVSASPPVPQGGADDE